MLHKEGLFKDKTCHHANFRMDEFHSLNLNKWRNSCFYLV